MKKWLIVASVLIVGCILIIGGSSIMTKYQTNHYEVDLDYKNISIGANTADILFAPSESGDTYVICNEPKDTKCYISVENSTLSIWFSDTGKWYQHIAGLLRTPKITVYLPQNEYGFLSISSDTGDINIPDDFTFESIDISESTGDVTVYASVSNTAKIKATTGDISVKGISAGVLDLSVSTGRIIVSDVICAGSVSASVTTGKTDLANISCKNLISSGSTGDITLHNVIAEEKFTIKRSTGDIKFNNSDASEIFAETDTGDITGNILSDKIFIAETDTGDIDVPKTTIGGKCELSTSTGDIRITTTN